MKPLLRLLFCMGILPITPLAAQELPAGETADAENGVPVFPGEAPEDVTSAAYDIWVDDMRNWLYGVSHGSVVWADNRFVDETKQERVPTPPSRFRIGVLSVVELKPDGKITFAPDGEFDADVGLPNLEERAKLFVTTRDPTALTGTDAFDQDADLRVGASRKFFENWRTDAGVKVRWPPELFVSLKWGPKYALGPQWELWPEIKLSWESEDKLGASTAVTAGRWRGRMLYRQSLSAKITQNDMEEDEDRSTDPEDSQFMADGGGVRWQATTIFGYVTELINDADYGRQVSGADIGKGIGLRGQISGNQQNSLRATTTLFLKRPLYKDFLFYTLAPEVIWDEEENWDEEFVLKAGIEMYLWGEDTFRAAP